MHLSRSVYRYQAKLKDDSEIAEQLRQLAERKPRWGLGKMFHRLRSQGYLWNRKRVRWVYLAERLNLRVKPNKRLPIRHPTPLAQPAAVNESWSVDFMSDIRGARSVPSMSSTITIGKCWPLKSTPLCPPAGSCGFWK